MFLYRQLVVLFEQREACGGQRENSILIRDERRRKSKEYGKLFK